MKQQNLRDHSYDRIAGSRKNNLDRSAPTSLLNQTSRRESSKKLKGKSSKPSSLASGSSLKLGKLASLIAGKSASSIRGPRPPSPTGTPINYYSINNYNIYPRTPSDRLITRSSAKSGQEIFGQQNLREELRKVFMTKHEKGLLVRSGSRDYQERVHIPEARSSKPKQRLVVAPTIASEVLVYPQISTPNRDYSPGAQPMTTRKSGFFLKKTKMNPLVKAGSEYEKQNSASFSHKSYSTIKRPSKSQKRQGASRAADALEHSHVGEHDTSLQQLQSGSRLANDSVDDYPLDSGKSRNRGSWRIESTSRSNSRTVGPHHYIELPKRSFTIGGHPGSDDNSVFDQLAHSLQGFQQDLTKTRRTWNRSSICSSVDTVRQSKPLILLPPTPAPSPLSLATSRANTLLTSLVSLLANAPTPSLTTYLAHPAPSSLGLQTPAPKTATPIAFSNLNFHNLVREYTRHMMLKTNRLLSTHHGTEERLLPSLQQMDASKRDRLKEGLFGQVAHLYQQQQVIEDVVLQLKGLGLDVDSVFQRAYVLLGIVAKEDPPEGDDGLNLLDADEQAPLDEVSVEGGLRDGELNDKIELQTPREGQKEGVLQGLQVAPEGGWVFPLDFNRLEYSVSQQNSAEEQD